jgi:uncharacterized protein (DUF4415 family)
MKDDVTRVSLGKGGKGKTDWKRVDAMSDTDITEAMASDPDTFEPEPAWFANALILRPHQPKERLTVRFDADMVHWFKEQGGGYQTRMNAILRAYYEAQKAKSEREHGEAGDK